MAPLRGRISLRRDLHWVPPIITLCTFCLCIDLC
uniref:Uncharacterized protein n=1 Tax=Anguilla anguilla TaxID=7936 RepID=A0A0E9PIC9_ANGAN